MDDFKWRLSWYAATFLVVPTFVILTFALVTEKFHWFITFYMLLFSLISLACVSARWIMCGDVRKDADDDLSLIHIPSPRDATLSRMPSSA